MIREHITGWLARALAAALALALVDLVLAALMLSGAAGGVLAGVHLFHMIAAQYLVFALPLALAGAVIDSRGWKRAFPDPAAVIAAGLGSWAALVLVQRLARLPEAYAEFPQRVALVSTLASLLGVAALAAIMVYGVVPALRWLLQRAPKLGQPRAVSVAAAVVIAALLVATAQLGLGPVHINRPAALVGVASLATLLVALRWALPVVAPRLRRAAAVLVPLVVLALPLSWRDLHARYVLSAHCHVAGPLHQLLRSAADFDGDGTSPTWLGGTDCAAFDARRAPPQRELPGDGIDQDCQGGDATPAAPVAPSGARAYPGCSALPAGTPVIFVTVDALGTNSLSEQVTPLMLRLAADSQVYERAYAPATFTVLTFSAIFTGRPFSDIASDNLVRDPTIDVGTVLARRFQRAGYATLAFNVYPLSEALYTAFDVRNPHLVDAYPRSPSHGFTAAGITDGALASVDALGPRPYFLWLHYPDAHAPYLDPHDSKFAHGEISAHDREVAYVDFHVGRLIAGLEQRGVLARAIVVITADHGEEQLLRGREGHGPNPFEETIRVPLFVHVPGCAPRVLDTPASLVRLGATLGALAGVPVPGLTLLPGDLERGPAVVAEAISQEGEFRRAVIGPRYKLLIDVVNGGRLLFDLEADPGETQDLYASQPSVARELEAVYQAWLDRGAP